MTVDIRFEHFEDPTNKTRIAAMLERFAFLYPSWLQSLTISITDVVPDNGCICWNVGRPEYGSAMIVLVSRWLDRDPELQRSDLLHEVLHVAHRREYNFVRDRLLNEIAQLDEEEKLHDYLVEDYRLHNEEFIQGLANAILKRVYPEQLLCSRCSEPILDGSARVVEWPLTYCGKCYGLEV